MSSARWRAVPVLACLAVSQMGVPRAHAQSAIEPFFMVMVDTSGSMDIATPGTGNNTCGGPRRRLSDARCVLQRVVNGYGDVRFGLGRFQQTWGGGPCASSCTIGDGAAGPVCGCTLSAASCTATSGSGEILVPLALDNQADILNWINYSCGASSCASYVASSDPELRAGGRTPLGGTLLAARDYYMGASSPLIGDPAGTCRPVGVILLTDGIENCGGNAPAVAAQLRSTLVGGRTYDIQTYPIGFGVAVGDPGIEAIATNGGVDAGAPGGTRGFYATDEASLALAFSEIIERSIRYEVCNGVDDNCNGLVDEGFTVWCNRPASHPAQDLCSDPGETVCNGTDDNCNGLVDEGFTLYCNRPAGVSTRSLCANPGETVCDGVDDNCNGIIDEGVCGGCVPSAEICDGLDNDCDGTIDDGLTRGCGTDVGECVAGTQTCSAGSWGACVGSVGPVAETCNNRDDDCNGVVDGFGRPCGSDVGACQAGVEICSAGAFGACLGAVGPTTEVCNNVDDDCDGSTDELNPGGGGPCGSSLGECAPGTLQCMGGSLVCVGGVSPVAETCNGRDDNCDGLVDEGNPGGGATCGSTDVGECDFGALVCAGGALVCRGETGPTAERCDGRDNDCDGMTDEMNPEGGVACGNDTGECTAGITLCTAGMLVCDGGTGPTPEVCNGLDDDCDGVEDEGIPVGAPCGSDIGECSPGVNICRSGGLVCEGQIGPVDEVCNALDDDCDGSVDEALPVGVTCGTDEGVCMTGTVQCIGGVETCVGETPGGPETCDCEDNDCDGMTDEPPDGGSLCPAGTACIACSCSRECVMSEFGPQCPTGTVAETTDGTCWCVRPRCTDEACGAETIARDGTTLCAPSGDGLGPCVCRNNECTFSCDGVVCTSPLVCRPSDGACVSNDCVGLGCPSGEICDVTTGACTADPCTPDTCAADQACREGTCETSCADVSCASGERCERGECVADPCAGSSCGATDVCDPADGTCVDDLCITVICGEGMVCDPLTGDCEPDPCTPLHCPDGQICQEGECARLVVETDAGILGMDGGVRVDAGSEDDGPTRVVATGGGGCLCAAPGSSSSSTSGGGLGSIALAIGIGLAVTRRRRAARRGGAR